MGAATTKDLRWQSRPTTTSRRMSFEAALAELEQIVGKLEGGKAPLAESIAIYERGEALKAHCEALLKAAEARIEKITLPRRQAGRHRAARRLSSDCPWPPCAPGSPAFPHHPLDPVGRRRASARRRCSCSGRRRGRWASPGTPFALDSTKGGTFTQDDLKGTPSLVFFGYTFCPDVCPTTMAETTAWRQQLGLTPDQLRTIFVTVDPARDTLPVRQDYVEGVRPDHHRAGRRRRADRGGQGRRSASVGNQAPDADDNYLVNHTASVFLIGKNGEFEGTIAYGEDKAIGPRQDQAAGRRLSHGRASASTWRSKPAGWCPAGPGRATRSCAAR